MLSLCRKTYCCYDSISNKFKIISKGLKKRTFENSRDGTMAESWKVLDKLEKVTPTNRVFRQKNYRVAAYEQTLKGLSHYYTKPIVETVGMRTLPLQS